MAKPDKNWVDSTVGQLAGFWSHYGPHIVLAGLITAAGLVTVSFVVARRRGSSDTWLANIAYLAVMALSAEGMWTVIRQRLHLPIALAACVCAVAEVAMISEANQATRLYKRSTIRDSQGQIVTPGYPGKHGRMVWIIAVAAGAIVATNASSVPEFLLRLALPLAAAGMWWNALTSEGATRQQGTWRWTPRRLLIAVGAITADSADIEQINRERHIRTMTRLARRVHHGHKPLRLHLTRLERLALDADDDMIAQVRQRVARADRVRELTHPDMTHATSANATPVTSTSSVIGQATTDATGHASSATTRVAFGQPVSAAIATRRMSPVTVKLQQNTANQKANRVMSGATGDTTPEATSATMRHMSHATPPATDVAGHMSAIGHRPGDPTPVTDATPATRQTTSDAMTCPATSDIATVRQLLERQPDMTGAAIARHLNCSPRTGQRLRRQILASGPISVA